MARRRSSLILAAACYFMVGSTAKRAIHHLDLSHQPLLNKECLQKSIPATLHLDLSHNMLGDDGMEELLNMMLEKNITRTILDASNNNISPKGARALLKLLLNQQERKLDSLDLSWSHLHAEKAALLNFFKATENIVGSSTCCPHSIALDCCGLGAAVCRAIGKGIIHRYRSTTNPTPLSLSLCGNSELRDAGVAAIAASIRKVAAGGKSIPTDMALFDRLTLSGCNIGDTGVEALALALESAPGCIRHLDLSNNRISEKGIQALSLALSSSPGRQHTLTSLDLSNNPLNDLGASAVAKHIIPSGVSNIVLRSCNIQADGASSIGRALRKLTFLPHTRHLFLDLSGNPLGVLTSESSGKYSASRLSSKASATATMYVNQGFNMLKKGLKDVGVDMGTGGEFDDERSAEQEVIDMLGGEVDAARGAVAGGH